MYRTEDPKRISVWSDVDTRKAGWKKKKKKEVGRKEEEQKEQCGHGQIFMPDWDLSPVRMRRERKAEPIV